MIMGEVTDEEFRPVPLPMAGQRPPERRDAAANRARIIEAARRLLAEGGLDELTMEGVARAAGVGKGTVFRRFGSRAGLAGALVDEEMRDFQDRLLYGPPPLGPGAPAAERLEAFVVELIRNSRQNLPVAVLAAKELDQSKAEPIAGLLLHLRNLVEQVDPDLDGQVVATMIFGAIAAPLVQGDHDKEVDEDALETAALRLLSGITRPR